MVLANYALKLALNAHLSQFAVHAQQAFISRIINALKHA
jgi:hypothetical protein